MRLLVLGGTHHVGRAVVEAGLARGDEVTTLNRGLSASPGPGVHALQADRRDHVAMASALGRGQWDAVVDTWSQEPSAVHGAARLLEGRTGHYTYVSSRSVYEWPPPLGADESAPVVEADPDDEGADDYAVAKRGGELAVLDCFGARSLIARAGLILGPYERVGRLAWWLRRVASGGPVLAPAPAGRRLQYIDGRDLADWVLACAADGVGGVFNCVGPPGVATMGSLLAAVLEVTGAAAELIWVPAEVITAAGIEPWTGLPIWTPETPEWGAMHDGDVTAALASGLRHRPPLVTVRDTWDWLQREGLPAPPAGRPVLGLDPDVERRVLADWAAG
jgi:nucleoside-diphosphate-sugar epimerase